MYEKIYQEIERNNRGQLAGQIVSEPIFSHETYGEKFYEVMLEIKRLSGQADIIPVTFSERLTRDKSKIMPGNQFAVVGEYHSHNKLVDGRSKLLLTFFAKNIIEGEIKSPDINNLTLCGYVCKKPIFRVTPFSREICDLLLAVNRAYNKSDYIPCIAWGRNARFAEGLQIGDRIALEGRIQSRPYVKQESGQEKHYTAYEVSIQKLEEVDSDGDKTQSKSQTDEEVS